MLDAFSLSGKNALVTGSNKGLGAAIVVVLAQAGANVAVHGRSEAASDYIHGHVLVVDGGWMGR